MKPAGSFLPALLLAGPLLAQTPEPVLEVQVGDPVAFTVTGPDTPFLGAVIVSLSPALAHWFQGLPPLLTDFAVLGAGAAEGQYAVTVPRDRLPAGTKLHAQGVVAAEATGVLSTAVVTFVLDARSPGP